MPLLRRPAAVRTARAFTYFVAFALICFLLWINKYFGRPDLDQIVYHASLGPDGLLDSDPVVIERFFRWCVAGPLVLAAVALAIEWRGNGARLPGRLPSSLRRLASAITAHMPQLLLAVAAVYWVVDTSAVRYIGKNFGADYFGAHYVPPGAVPLQATHTKNLVLIYMESLEAAYANQSLFGADRIAPLTQLQGESFTRYRQAPGTGWTIAAIVATQCGVPLERVGLFDINTQGQVIDDFLPGATCLSDILERQGYRNVFMGGASLRFAGKGNFLRSHHYDETYGKEDWVAQGADPRRMNGWGLYDDELFAHARDKLRQLHAAGKPFNLTVLTVDTHEPAGFRPRHCDVRGEPFEGVVECSAREVADFVAFIKQSGYLDDTNVVILGDHLARKNPVADRLETLPERFIFNKFISQAPMHKNREEIVHFDLLPTVLEFIGFDARRRQVGLGFGGFGAGDAKPEAGRFAKMNESLLNRSDAYLRLWEPESPTPFAEEHKPVEQAAL
ncbi:MAG: sulfatase-like hydrolase/transferase [Telluria sp.]